MTTLSSTRADVRPPRSLRVRHPASRLGPLLCVALSLAGSRCAHSGASPEEREQAITQKDLGVDAMHQKDFRGALGYLNKALELNDEDPDVHYALGVVYFGGFARMDEAEKHFRRAGQLRPDFSDAHNALGNVYLARNRCDLAVPLFRKAMDNLTWPTPFMAEQNLGWCLYRAGKKDQGIAHLKNAVNLKPTLCGGYDYLARIYVEENREADSVVWLERYLKNCDTTDAVRATLPPNQLASVFYRLGMARVRAGDHSNGRAALATCVERFADSPVVTECRKSLGALE
jgi:type IV pilus assembly protein PilF